MNSSKLHLIGRPRGFLLLAVIGIGLAGCATVTRSGWEQLVVQSEPSGANVRLSNGITGVTPVSFGISRKDDLTVTVTKEGYEPATVEVKSRWTTGGKAGMVGNVPLVAAAGVGVIGAGVDLATGATRSLVPNPVKVTLRPVVPRAPPAAGGSRPSQPDSGHDLQAE